MITVTYIQPKFYEDIKLDEECSKPNVAKIYQLQITRFFLGQILNSICCLCNNYDVSQL